ncbi:trypsin-like peptidase domain-containing protein [Prosthecobacter vanneervenii]|uniref:S1-C subfamily serine protease/regulator of sirC expression with transglutaminase-like and TPR domain n=1 Tax=Prosthecobacter vanneervenii TaxID=48466 RepID=A0A7W7Y778_9BACT|nr:trypsin-like peptidase domain-containing protein [Prosthecobacter vanneervenii]MBB5030702.1 S1-C subfamily serine protease/regulator of sirC expression with transglutaminase-like and TPR domain [Prosthecobacter vanneervenii]
MRPVYLLLLTSLLLGQAHAASKPKVPASATKPAAPAARTAAELAAAIRPSLVKITQIGREGTDGIGSGFVVSEDGLIATNLHVIGEARRLQIEMHDGKTHDVSVVQASDNHHDLALLKIEAKGLKPLPLGDSSKVQQGEPIVAMGAPEGLAFSIVQGVLSATREVDGLEMLQVAVPIEKGNSGGPLLDMQGRVLGLLTLKSLKTDNLGFAMPVNELKNLIEKPNPVPMSRWLTIGALNPKLWHSHLGAQWTQHAGVIRSEFPGSGFGGRALCLSTQKVPEETFEIAATVKMDDESGAAGLTFCSDGGDKHYGFYPSGGKLRLTRFNGPDVYSWTILADVPSDAYKSGDWNTLRVRVEPERIVCYVNGKQVIESDDTGIRAGAAGLCKFRTTVAEFRNFRIGTDLAEKPLQPELASRLRSKVQEYVATAATTDQTLEGLLENPGAARRVLVEQRRRLEEEAVRLRDLERELHRRAMTKDILAELAKPEPEINLLRCSLLLARHDNPEIDISTYMSSFKAMVLDLKDDPEIKKGTIAAVKRLNRYLFEENGFHGSRGDYSNRSNSYLNEVIDDREGLPITLSVLYIELASALGVQGVFGVPLPGKFMVGYRDGPEGELQLVDVFEHGKLVTVEQAALDLTEDGRFPEAALAPTTKQAILLRMLRNLMSSVFDDSRSLRDSLPYLNLVLAIDPQAAAERLTRAQMRQRLGEKAGAREDVGWLIQNFPEDGPPELMQQLDRWMQSLRE